MEFTLICPNDGQVELGLEDISTIAFRGPRVGRSRLRVPPVRHVASRRAAGPQPARGRNGTRPVLPRSDDGADPEIEADRSRPRTRVRPRAAARSAGSGRASRTASTSAGNSRTSSASRTCSPSSTATSAEPAPSSAWRVVATCAAVPREREHEPGREPADVREPRHAAALRDIRRERCEAAAELQDEPESDRRGTRARARPR